MTDYMEDFELTVSQASAVLKQPRNTIYALAYLGVLPARATMDHLLFRVHDVFDLQDKIREGKRRVMRERAGSDNT